MAINILPQMSPCASDGMAAVRRRNHRKVRPDRALRPLSHLGSLADGGLQDSSLSTSQDFTEGRGPDPDQFAEVGEAYLARELEISLLQSPP